jgi:DNA polymerase III alpha subunit (gram-positive type)
MVSGSEVVQEIITELRTKPNLQYREQSLLTNLEVASEMLTRGIEVCNIDLNASQLNEFVVITDNDNQKKLLPPLMSINSFGPTIAQKVIEERKKANFTSSEDFIKRTKITKANLENLQSLGVLASF